MLRLGRRSSLRSFFPWYAAVSAEEHFPSPWQRGRNTIWLSAEDLLDKAAPRFWLPTTQAAVPGLPLGPEVPWNLWTSSPQQFSFSAPLFFSWKWLKVIKTILVAHVKESPSLLPRQQQHMERAGQGEPFSQRVYGWNTYWDSWTDWEEAPESGT